MVSDLACRGLIVSSLDRDLTEAGQQIVDQALLIIYQESNVYLETRKLVEIVRRLRQGDLELSEMDAFICEASDLIWTQISEEQKQEIDVLKCQGSMLRRGTYILAGMHVLREATKAGLIEVNPINSPPGDQQYIAYV